MGVYWELLFVKTFWEEVFTMLILGTTFLGHFLRIFPWRNFFLRVEDEDTAQLVRRG